MTDDIQKLSDADYQTFLQVIKNINISRADDQKISTKFLLALDATKGKKAVLNFLERHEDYHDNSSSNSEEDALQNGDSQPNFQLLGYEKTMLSMVGCYQPAHDQKTRRELFEWTAALGVGAIATSTMSKELKTNPSKKDTTLALNCLGTVCVGLGLVSLIKALNAPDESQRQEAYKAVKDLLWDMSYTLRECNPRLEQKNIDLQFFR